MKKYIYKISLFFGFLALGTSHLQAVKILFRYERDDFDTLHLLEKPSPAQVANYSEKPDVRKEDLAMSPEPRLVKNAADFFMAVEGTGAPSRMIFQEIYGAALELSNAADREKPQTVIFLGRSPTFLKETLQQLYKLEPKEGRPSLVQVAFSGSPDIKSKNKGLQNFPYLRNVLTPKRVQVFFQYLDSLGFDKIRGEMWLVDSLTSGGGLNSFIRLLRGYYLKKEMPFPDFRFWSIGFPEGSITNDAHTFEFDYGRKMLSFPGNLSDLGYKAMDIPCVPLRLHERARVLIDNDLIEHCYGGVQEYHAWKMKSLDKNPVPPQTPGVDFSLFRDKILMPVVTLLHKKGGHALDRFTSENRKVFMCQILKWVPLEILITPPPNDPFARLFEQLTQAQRAMLFQAKYAMSGPQEKERDLLKALGDIYAAKEKGLEKPLRTYSAGDGSQ